MAAAFLAYLDSLPDVLGKKVGVDARVEIWEGALHGWTMRDLPVFNPEAAKRHVRELIALFDGTLKG